MMGTSIKIFKCYKRDFILHDIVQYIHTNSKCTYLLHKVIKHFEHIMKKTTKTYFLFSILNL